MSNSLAAVVALKISVEFMHKYRNNFSINRGLRTLNKGWFLFCCASFQHSKVYGIIKNKAEIVENCNVPATR